MLTASALLPAPLLAAEVVLLRPPNPVKQRTATITIRFKAAMVVIRLRASSELPFNSFTSGTRLSVQDVPISGLATRYASAFLPRESVEV